jgi:cleavage stimulation factor subunit 3
MMEFHSNKDAAVAIKILDLGLKKFPNEVEYVIRHLQFLLSINDDTSESRSLLENRVSLMIDARALFERSALNIPAEKARPLWDAWARYEYMYGDLAAVNKLEARFAEVFPNGMASCSLAQVVDEADDQILHSRG